jgi:hypothetical protein
MMNGSPCLLSRLFAALALAVMLLAAGGGGARAAAPADDPGEAWRNRRSTLALNLGLGSAVGLVGLTYSYLPVSMLETEVGFGLGSLGSQFSVMEKLVIGGGSTRFIMGAGLAYSPAPGVFGHDIRHRDLWLNLDVAGLEYRHKGGFVFFLAAGDTHAFGGPIELLSIDCGESADACRDAGNDFFQIRTGLGVSF